MKDGTIITLLKIGCQDGSTKAIAPTSPDTVMVHFQYATSMLQSVSMLASLKQVA
jgi:hypothetical protein